MEFQNIFAYDQTRQLVVLVKWDVDEGNNPGFKPVLLSKKSKKITELNRVPGCCNNIFLNKDTIVFDVFRHPETVQVEFKIPN